MADNDLEIKFGADTAALSAGVEIAKADVDKIVQAIALLQKTVGAAARTTTTELTAAFQGMGSQASSAAPRVRQMAEEVQRLSTAGHSGHGTIFGMQTGVFLELRALLDESLAGRMRNFEGSFARLLGMIGPSIVSFVTLNPMLAAFGVAAAAAAGTAAYLAIEMHAVAAAQDDINRGRAFSGNFNIVDPGVLEKTRQQLESLKGIFHGLGEADIAKITVEFARMGNASNEVIGAMTADMTTMWKAFGDKEAEAAKSIVDVFSEPLAPIDRIAKSLNGLSEAERKFIADAQRAGNPLQAQAAIQQVVAQRSAQYHSARIHEIDAEIAKEQARQATLLAGDQTTRRMLQDYINDLQKEKEEAQNVDDALAKWADKIRAAASTSQMLGDEFRKIKDEADKVADSYDRIGAAARKVGADSATLFSGIFQAAKSGDLEETTRLLGALPKLVSDAQVNRQQGGDPLGLGRDAIKQAEEAIKQWQATTGASQDQVRAHSAQVWKAMASDQSLSVEQQHEVYEKYLDTVVSGASAASKASAKAAKDELGATEEGIKGQIKAQEDATRARLDHLNAEVKLKAITQATATADTIKELAKEKAAVDALYAQEAALAGLSLTKKKAIADQEVAFNDEIALKTQEAQEKAAEATQKTWDSAFKEINSAFDSQVNGLLRGTTSWSQAFKNVLASLTEDMIKFFLNWGLQQAEKTAMALTLNNSEVAAHVAGDATKTAADATANSAGIGGMIANAIHAITIDAGQASAGVTAFLAPILGPAAPAAGAAAGSSVLAMAAFDIGAWNVPQNQLAMIHRNELVMPAAEAGAFRSMLSGAAGGDGGGMGGSVSVNPSTHFHVSAVDGASVASFFRNNQREMMKAVNAAVRQGAHLGLRRLAPG